MVSYFEGAEEHGKWHCQSRLEGDLAGIFAVDEMLPLMSELRDSISAHVGDTVMRIRVHIEPGAEPTVDYMVDALRQSPRWWWPDESGYEGPIYPTAPKSVERIDGAYYRATPVGVDVSSGPALQRILAWLSVNVVFFAEAFNPPASVEEVEETEARLGVTFPRSVRDAYLTFDGHSLDEWVFGKYRWMPLAELKRVGERPDGLLTVPLMLTPGAGYCFVESAAWPDEEPEFVQWQARERSDVRLADSFGAYLQQFADDLEAGEHTYRDESEALVRDGDW